MRMSNAWLHRFVAVFASMLVATVALAGGVRHSGSVVETGRGSLVVDELGRGGKAHKLRIDVTPKTRLVDSMRNPQASGAQDAFTDKNIDLSDIKKGDFVVVDLSREGNRLVAESVTVTLRVGGK